MEKIVIIGASGAGKSTLAKGLGPILKIKVFHLDRFFWQRGWKRRTGNSRIDILQDLVREKGWIIVGKLSQLSRTSLGSGRYYYFFGYSSPVMLLSGN